MGKIIAVANQKGGVGKTTTAINLSAAIAEKDRKVLLVDLDSQSNATSGVGVDKNTVENSTYELISGSCSFDDCLIHTEFKNLDVLPSSQDLTAAEIELLDEDQRNYKLKEVLDGIKEQYEFIIIDCPPSLSLLTVNALTAADSVLVPIQCEYYALEGLSQLLQTISLVKERVNASLRIEGIVFTMYDPRVRLSGQVVQNVKANLPEKTFRTVIPRNVRLAEAPSHGKPVMYYTRFCSGTRAYRNFAKEIVAAYEAELSAAEKQKALNEAENTASAEPEDNSTGAETSVETAGSAETTSSAETEENASGITNESEEINQAEEKQEHSSEDETAKKAEPENETVSEIGTNAEADTEPESETVNKAETGQSGVTEAVEETETKEITETAEDEVNSEKNKDNEVPDSSENKETGLGINKYEDIIRRAEEEINAG